MSLLLRRMSKVCLCKKAVSCFSTAITSRSKPYLLLGTEIKENFLNFNLYDLIENKEMVKNLNIEDQSHTLRNLLHKSLVIGSSRGHVALRNGEDSSVHLVDISNQAKPKIISLPPLYFDKCEEDINVSVSSPVNGENNSVIVAVKFRGSRLSLCRVGDSEWTRIDVTCPNFAFSAVMYLEREGKFSLTNFWPTYIGPIDFVPKSGLVTPVSAYLKFPIENIAELEKDLKSSSYASIRDITSFEKESNEFKNRQQLVESSSGQSFIVYRFIDIFYKKGEKVNWDDEFTQEIIVFKQDEEKEIGVYTKDIGDLCIFLGKNEVFCVSASEYPGLKPNSVYFACDGSDVGVYDLSSRTVVRFSDNLTPQPHGPMFWIPPTLASSFN